MAKKVSTSYIASEDGLLPVISQFTPPLAPHFTEGAEQIKFSYHKNKSEKKRHQKIVHAENSRFEFTGKNFG